MQDKQKHIICLVRCIIYLSPVACSLIKLLKVVSCEPEFKLLILYMLYLEKDLIYCHKQNLIF